MTNHRNSSSRRGSALLALLSLMIAATTAVTMTTSSPAVAACSGVNSGYTIGSGAGGANGGRETFSSGTCDNLTDYNGKVLDVVNGDGCVWTYFNTSAGFPVPGPGTTQGTSARQCSTSTWLSYGYWDVDSVGWIRMCRDSVGCTATYYQQTGY